ncbi:MAG TPA: methyltransferase domain-containing protein [Solirubrobacteraceae bacterium]|jgi:SAM-dependent methyltransferase
MSNQAADQVAPKPAEVWSAGDYAGVCDRMIPRLGERLVELAGVKQGELVLDVAAGSGNASLPAAAAGATITALDITPQLLEVGAERAAAAGLDVAWVLADAQALPFPDASFDKALSCVGVQFCADPLAASAELMRICRDGGRIALISWTPEGFIGQVLAAVSRATGATRGGSSSPLDWGREDTVEGWFGTARAVAAQRERVAMPAGSAAEWVDFMADAYGPLLRARKALQGKGAWEPLREQLCEIAAAHDTGGADGFAGSAEYLAVTVDC